MLLAIEKRKQPAGNFLGGLLLFDLQNNVLTYVLA